jgi:hypothetical protein
LNLWAHRVFATPVGVEGEAIGVEVRSNLCIVSPYPET